MEFTNTITIDRRPAKVFDFLGFHPRQVRALARVKAAVAAKLDELKHVLEAMDPSSRSSIRSDR